MAVQEVSWKVAVHELSQSPQYRAIVEKVQSLAPSVPVYDYMGAGNIEEIKFKLAQEAMLDLVLTVLKGKAE